VGLIFPVHIWGLPHRVIQFLNRLQTGRETYLFALAVNAGQVAATLLQLKKSMAKEDGHLPWLFRRHAYQLHSMGWSGALETQQRRFEGNT
jgi:hypothetical protein